VEIESVFEERDPHVTRANRGESRSHHVNTQVNTQAHQGKGAILRNRSFLSLWFGQLIAFLGNSVYGLALMWEMKVLTGSTVMMSTVSIAQLVPYLVCGPIAGVLVDRWNKRSAMIWSDVIRSVVIGVLTLLLALHLLAPWMLIAGAAINSAMSSVYGPANSALIPMLVGKDSVQQANSMSQTAITVTQLVGPFVGGYLVAHVSMTSAFLLNAFTYLASVISLCFVTHREPERVFRPLDGKQFIVELKEGLDVIRGMPIMRAIIPIALIANFLFAPFEIILIQYCTDVLHGGAQLFGILGSFFSLGMLFGAIAAGLIAKKVKKGIIIAWAFPLGSLMMFGLAFTTTTYVALTLASLFGFFNMMVNITLMSIIQVQVPQDKMGRVSGSFSILIQGSQPFAQAAGGYLLSLCSVRVLMGVLAGLQTLNALYAATNRIMRSQE
jgi:DHA3 family macrolide efflux protein-like MFS transporter